MKRMVRMLTIAALSSVFVMQGACTLGTGDGISLIPTLTDLLANVPVIGATLQNLRQ